MSKLQMIKRKEGSVVYSSNIPIAMIRDLGWQKSDNLSLEIAKVRNRDVLIIFNDEDSLDIDLPGAPKEEDNGRD